MIDALLVMEEEIVEIGESRSNMQDKQNDAFLKIALLQKHLGENGPDTALMGDVLKERNALREEHLLAKNATRGAVNRYHRAVRHAREIEVIPNVVRKLCSKHEYIVFVARPKEGEDTALWCKLCDWDEQNIDDAPCVDVFGANDVMSDTGKLTALDGTEYVVESKALGFNWFIGRHGALLIVGAIDKRLEELRIRVGPISLRFE